MIEFESVIKQIQDKKAKIYKAKERIPELEQRVFDLAKEFTNAVIDGASDEKLSKIREKLTNAEKELDVLQGVDFEEQLRESLQRDEKLSKLADDFIKQEEKTLEKMVTEDEELTNKVLECYSALIEAVKARRTHRNKMVEITGRIDDIRSAMGEKVSRGTNFRNYEARMKSIAHDKMFNKIRIANGQLPEY